MQIKRLVKYKDKFFELFVAVASFFYFFLLFNQATTFAAYDKPKLEEIIGGFFVRIKEIENTNEIYVAFIFHSTKRIIIAFAHACVPFFALSAQK